ncbi:hypothetical protein AB0C59_25480 [Streptomyces sp. NPDC048664]|uniref:hypothetical protein n=1 Tax=Streptomyces sp. NPDC048664 TaxID=3154505 RepID=UPI00341BE82C
MGIRPPPRSGCAPGVSTVRLPGLSRTARALVLVTLAARALRDAWKARADRLRRLPGRSGPSCARVGDLRGHEADGSVAVRFRAVGAAVRASVAALCAAVHRRRFPSRPAGAVSGTSGPAAPFERPPGRPEPDARP